MQTPPSELNTCPVTKLEASKARYRINPSIEVKETAFRLPVLIYSHHFSFPAKSLKKGMESK
jgi:hypothetical protein